MSDEPILRASHVSRTFGEGNAMTTAVADVSLELHPGKITLLMGPSGSGKSTLLAMLGGLLRPSGGQIVAQGQDLWRLSEQDRHRFRLDHCGFIFQGFNLFPALSARQQLEIVLCLGMDVSRRKARRRADEMLGLLGLAGKAGLMPAEMSGGEKQRVAVARALIKEPTFCFADEPTAALDWAHGQGVVELLCSTCRQRHTTLIMVTHDARLTSYVDQMLHVNDGRLVETVGETHLGPVS
jgi:putative ABC transport system ATP-binding protein